MFHKTLLLFNSDCGKASEKTEWHKQFSATCGGHWQYSAYIFARTSFISQTENAQNNTGEILSSKLGTWHK